MENDSSGKAERENYETQNDCSTAFRNPAVLGSWMRKRSSDRQEHRSIVVSGSDGNSGGRRKPEASSSSADSTAESASASTSSESSGDEGKEADKKRIEITVPHKDGMEALYDTVDGLTVEKGSYIAVVAKDLSAGFWKAVKAGAQQALDDLNASLGYNGNDKVYMTFEGPENESDTNSQINIIDSVISENPDALILGIIDQQSGQAQMEEASDSQIPVVIADSGIESDLITSTCATDHAAAAKLAADHLCEAIGNSGEVAIVAHQYNTESSVERVEAFKKEIEEKYTDVKVVQVNYGDGEESIADMLKNTLETYPALKGIFCTNEDMADQTLDALADMENTEQIQIVGFDSGEKQQKAIQEGREYGTVTQNPYGLGYAAIVAAVRAIQGLPVDQKIDTGYQWIDKDTIDLETNQKYLYN
ncbi:hypothetical protein DXA55_07080 [Blautia sp. OF03-13]|nr:hypothetical protein DXA55_07080 [Blautia sp. OF03-13]